MSRQFAHLFIVIVLFTTAACERTPTSAAHYKVLELLQNKDYAKALQEVNRDLGKKPGSRNLLEVKLLLLLANESPRAREAVLETQKQIDALGGDRSLLLEQATNRISAVRKQTAYTLGVLGEPAGFDVLKDLAEDVDDTVRAEAVHALGKMQRPAAKNLLMIRLRDGSWNVRAEAANALAKLGDPSATGQLFRVVDDSDDYTRMQVLNAVIALANPTQVPFYLEKLASKNVADRTAAALALGKLRRWEAVPVLIELLKDKKAPERVQLAQCLTSFGTDALAANFKDFLKNEPNPQVKEVFADYLRDKSKPAPAP